MPKIEGKIILTKDTGSLDLSSAYDGDNLCIYHKSYELPKISNCRFIEFPKFKTDPRFYMKGIDRLFIVGSNKIQNPASRIDQVFEILHNNTPELEKIVVDKTLFVSEPWRTIFQFIITNIEYDIYTYSYLAESHYNAYLEEISDHNPFSLEEILKWAKGKVEVRYEKYFDTIKVETIEMDASVKKAYEAYKAELFETQSSIKIIIQKLNKFAREHCKQRKMPTKNNLFNNCNVEIIKTDLKVDDYLYGELLGLINLTNDISTHLYGGK